MTCETDDLHEKRICDSTTNFYSQKFTFDFNFIYSNKLRSYLDLKFVEIEYFVHTSP